MPARQTGQYKDVTMPMKPTYDHETIRRYLAAGLNATQIASRIGCSRAVVYKVAKQMARVA